jgi:transcription elongation factor GreA-like protein
MCKRLFTKNLTSIPLLWVDFNYKKYKGKGKQDSCIIRIHPILTNDEYIKNTLNELVDYIRDNYNMEDM